MPSKIKVVMLVEGRDSSRIMYHGLKNDFDILKVIKEKKPPKTQLLLRRLKTLGPSKVMGQVSFMLYNQYLSRRSRPQIEKIKERYRLDNAPFPKEKLVRVQTLNSEETKRLLTRLAPNAVVVEEVDTLHEDVLNCVRAPFLHTHVGIVPKYQGAHGGYWALTQQDIPNCGVTVLRMEKGDGSGGVLYQETITVSDKDNFNTYPYHQVAKAIPLMKSALRDVSGRQRIIRPSGQPARLWYYPTLVEYMKNRILHNVK